MVGCAACESSPKIVTLPSCHLFKPLKVLSQTLPSLDASTAPTIEPDRPSFLLNETTVKSRNRSSPLTVATQILPSRSSKILLTDSPERPSDGPNTSALP